MFSEAGLCPKPFQERMHFRKQSAIDRDGDITYLRPVAIFKITEDKDPGLS
jgi:hypothetical protein